MAAIRNLRAELEQLEEAQVANALSRGWSWARIGRALGVSRQAVHRKYSRCAPTPLPRARPGITNNVRVALLVARTEAAARGDALVGTEHLLIGLMQEGEGFVPGVLRAAGATLQGLRAALDRLAPSDVCSIKPSQISLTARASRALEHAGVLALRDDSERMNDVHLLRALLNDPNCGAVAALQAIGVRRGRVLAQLGSVVNGR